MTKKRLLPYLISILYVAMCAMLQPISFGPIQFRLSEILCLLTIENPKMILSVTAGCMLSNLLFSSFMITDAVVGSLATSIGCYLGYLLKNKKIKGYPIFSCLVISLINAIFIGIEIGLLMNNEKMIYIYMIQILLSEIIILIIIGMPIYKKLINLINKEGEKYEKISK